MPRRSILRGLPVPRSRAKQRGRLDRRQEEPATDERQAFFDFCRARFPKEDADLEWFERLDLDGFLKESAELEFPAGERLRLLAVFVDENLHIGFDAPVRLWKAFERVYQRAAKYAPADPWIQHSRSVTAEEICGGLERESDEFHAIWRDALHAARHAVTLRDDEPEVHYQLGYVLYMGPSRLVHNPSMCDEATTALDRALVLDPTHGWANLYRAHILHDLERWGEAADAYAQVNAAAFAGHQIWRYELLREQRAYCLLRADQRDEALTAFIDVIERRERAFDRGDDSYLSPVLMDPPFLLVEAANGPLRDELFDRVSVLVRRYDLPSLVEELESTE
jgi:tetratricopeptide (TPR) repeat protein